MSLAYPAGLGVGTGVRSCNADATPPNVSTNPKNLMDHFIDDRFIKPEKVVEQIEELVSKNIPETE